MFVIGSYFAPIQFNVSSMREGTLSGPPEYPVPNTLNNMPGHRRRHNPYLWDDSMRELREIDKIWFLASTRISSAEAAKAQGKYLIPLGVG